MSAPADRPWAGRRIHFVGVGGAGMSGYARVAVQLGATVSGSDRAPSPALDGLRALGVEVHVGHARENVPDGADVVFSSAVPADNPERVPGAVPRAELLHELSGLKRTIAIAGAHGKTTTTSMAAHVLLGCGLGPGYLIGGALRSTGQHADWGTGEWLVVEADESDRSMLRLQVELAAVLNVELDHHATYGSLAELEAVYAAFAAGAQRVVLSPGVALDGEVVAPADVELVPGGSRFTWRGVPVALEVPGAHNAANAALALEAAAHAGADPEAAAAALASFTGAGRRFERVGRHRSGALVVDDYAHHPTEVAATIAAARTLEAGRVLAVFQPHLFSRTQELHREFAAALATADLAVVLDVYPARERAEDFPGVDGRLLGGTFAPDFAAAREVLERELREDDVLLVMGAGDVTRFARELAT
ncbi:UDP-N-acetylmuramate--L-alanine ligase [Conexibacter sp. SYSU D00693]|uniref:UDP-N-acetylmuramate--L-alanine ligase n=1 Tax=Conexibacter sp. SYSU D00693 TaxID=2812560 RepID=UPI00196B5F58|nr:Mur ligase domain-containing protein [Conexibacter sp. SYSU D00693]